MKYRRVIKMNRKKIQRLSTFMAFLIVIPLVVMSVFACVKKTNNGENNEPQPPAVEDTDKGDTKGPIKDGIYSFEKDVTFSDAVYFVTPKELFTFFGTNDINGVKTVAISHGFNEFASRLTKYNGREKYLEFVDNSKVTSYYFDNGNYTLIRCPEFEYEYIDSEFISEGLNPKIENDAKNSVVTLYYPFYYKLDDGTDIITPLYVKTTLNYRTSSYDSEAIRDASVYKVQENSCKLVYNINSNIDMLEIQGKLADIFKIENSEDVFEKIENMLLGYKFAFNKDFTNVTLFSDVSGLSFSYHGIENFTFDAFGDVHFLIKNKSVGTAQIDELVLSVEVDEQVSLNFTVELVK